MLSSLIYASEVTDLGPGGVQGLLDQARANNTADCITGILCFNRRYFLQYLEGGREQLTATFARIALDPRHAYVSLISVTDLAERRCPDWTMAYLGSGTALRELYRRVSSRDAFEPRLLTEESAHVLIQRVLQHFGESGGTSQQEEPELAITR